ncbi:DUF4269 domain-containing protein [Bacillus sp. SG-1]|uniref:DUF4269 domain-containing protein n=1 Tax=Bacillus sp. SG-1 TaxID=161544 RepID=UPI0002FAFB0D|nr:DUF4269 domain-containing protein [Bacillus sp. SG-1]
MNDLLNKMKTGSAKQMAAWEAVNQLGILSDLKEYKPVLCGTIPIGIDTADSDLDIIMEVQDFEKFQRRLNKLYSHYNDYRIKRLFIRGMEVSKANFSYSGYQFELFGQAQPVNRQNAFLHMMIEHEILQKNPEMKEEVISLKKTGMKTEAAFCKLLGIEGDPYSGLIEYGDANGYLKRP